MILILLLIATIAAYQGYEPFTSTKDQVVVFVEKQVAYVESKVRGVEGINPFSTDVEKYVNKSNDTVISRPKMDIYVIPPSSWIVGDWITKDLMTVKKWEGSDAKEISFYSDKTPWIINASYKTTSNIASRFYITASTPTKFEGLERIYSASLSPAGWFAILVDDKGSFKINIDASGCDWWVRVGVEP